MSKRDSNGLNLEENLFMLRGVIGDLRRGFSRAVDLERWVADTQAFIDRIREQAQRANVSAATRSDSVVAEGVTAGETATCKHCGEEIRPDGDDWIDCETHTVCDTPDAPRHEPKASYAVTLPDVKYHRVKGEWIPVEEKPALAQLSLSELQRRYRLGTSNAMRLQDDLRSEAK